MASLLDRLLGRPRFDRRYEIIDYVIRTRGYQSYLEIGTSSGRSLARVRCARKVGVDPEPQAEPTNWELHKKTSDEFFAANREGFDCIFIDGLHHAEQVVRDIFHALAALRPRGLILIHDCNPLTERAQRRERGPDGSGTWNGDVWKAIAFVRQARPDLFCRVLARDHGIGLLFPIQEGSPPALTPEIEKEARACFESLSWEDLEKRRRDLLGLMHDREEFETELRRHAR
jgi:hypothetical protein